MSNDSTLQLKISDINDNKIYDDGWTEQSNMLLKKIYKKIKTRHHETTKATKYFDRLDTITHYGLLTFTALTSIITLTGSSNVFNDHQKNIILIVSGSMCVINTLLQTLKNSQNYQRKYIMNLIMAKLFDSQKNDIQNLIYSLTDNRGDVNIVLNQQTKQMAVIDAIAFCI